MFVEILKISVNLLLNLTAKITLRLTKLEKPISTFTVFSFIYCTVTEG